MPFAALRQRLLYCSEGAGPRVAGWSRVRAGMSCDKALAKQICGCYIKRLDAWRTRRHLDRMGRGCVWIHSLPNGSFQRRRVASAPPLDAEWVVPFHEELKDENCQGKPVMFVRAIH
jgi:hypothetical protein